MSKETAEAHGSAFAQVGYSRLGFCTQTQVGNIRRGFCTGAQVGNIRLGYFTGAQVGSIRLALAGVIAPLAWLTCAGWRYRMLAPGGGAVKYFCKTTPCTVAAAAGKAAISVADA